MVVESPRCAGEVPRAKPFEEISFAFEFNVESRGIEPVAFEETSSHGTNFVRMNTFGNFPLRRGAKKKMRPSHGEHEFVFRINLSCAKPFDCGLPARLKDFAEFSEASGIG